MIPPWQSNSFYIYKLSKRRAKTRVFSFFSFYWFFDRGACTGVC